MPAGVADEQIFERRVERVDPAQRGSRTLGDLVEAARDGLPVDRFVEQDAEFVAVDRDVGDPGQAALTLV